MVPSFLASGAFGAEQIRCRGSLQVAASSRVLVVRAWICASRVKPLWAARRRAAEPGIRGWRLLLLPWPARHATASRRGIT